MPGAGSSLESQRRCRAEDAAANGDEDDRDKVKVCGRRRIAERERAAAEGDRRALQLSDCKPDSSQRWRPVLMRMVQGLDGNCASPRPSVVAVPTRAPRVGVAKCYRTTELLLYFPHRSKQLPTQDRSLNRYPSP